MLIEYKSPNLETYRDNCVSVFLAGSIEMGAASPWHDEVIEYLKTSVYRNVDVFNPRRTDWDDSWKQTSKDKNFKEQVNWEIDHIDSSEFIFFNIENDTKSPITLLELGYVCKNKNKTIVVCCGDKFWRRGNVEVMCERNNIMLFDDFSKALGFLSYTINSSDLIIG